MEAAPRTGAVFLLPGSDPGGGVRAALGKTEALSIDIASLALDERNCRQLVVAPTDAQARLLGNEVLLRLLDAWEWRDAEGRQHPSVAGREITVRQRPALSIVPDVAGGSLRRRRCPSTFGRRGGTGGGYGGCGRTGSWRMRRHGCRIRC